MFLQCAADTGMSDVSEKNLKSSIVTIIMESSVATILKGGGELCTDGLQINI